MHNIKFEREYDLESAICELLDGGECPVTGNMIVSNERQYIIPGYGTADIVAFAKECIEAPDKPGDIIKWQRIVMLYELKNEPLKLKHVAQLMRYRTGMLRTGLFDSENTVLHCVLIGPHYAPSDDDAYLMQSLGDNFTVTTFGIDLHHGIEFEDVYGWHSKSERPDELKDKLIDMLPPADEEFIPNER